MKRRRQQQQKNKKHKKRDEIEAKRKTVSKTSFSVVVIVIIVVIVVVVAAAVVVGRKHSIESLTKASREEEWHIKTNKQTNTHTQQWRTRENLAKKSLYTIKSRLKRRLHSSELCVRYLMPHRRYVHVYHWCGIYVSFICQFRSNFPQAKETVLIVFIDEHINIFNDTLLVYISSLQLVCWCFRDFQNKENENMNQNQ